MAAENGLEDTIRVLLGFKNLDVNKANRYGETPLMLAVLDNSSNITRMFRKLANPDVNKRDNEGNTALIYAAYYGETKAIEALGEFENIDVSLRDNDGKDVLTKAREKKWNDRSVVTALEKLYTAKGV